MKVGLEIKKHHVFETHLSLRSDFIRNHRILSDIFFSSLFLRHSHYTKTLLSCFNFEQGAFLLVKPSQARRLLRVWAGSLPSLSLRRYKFEPIN